MTDLILTVLICYGISVPIVRYIAGGSWAEAAKWPLRLFRKPEA